MNCPDCKTEIPEADQRSGGCPKCGVNAEPQDSTCLMPEDANVVKSGLDAFIQDAIIAQSSEVLDRGLLEKMSIKRRIIDDGSGHSEGADYEIKAVLGRGGMGVVYEARQTAVDRTTALKIMKPESAANDRYRFKFLSEAAATADLDHPNIVPIYELGESEDGALFYSMKRVQGVPWSEVMKGKALRENVNILMRVADAVAYAHARGIIHRDLKPSNVMLGDYGEVLVMDWGMAVSITADGKAAQIESFADVGGTPAYMSPEMASGKFSRVGVGTDIYLLGAILFEIITGRPPHPGSTTSEYLVAATRNEILPWDIEGEHIDIALKAMQTEVTDRFENVKSFQEAVGDFISHSESISRCQRAASDLAKACESNDYDDFALALFGYKEAVDLWRDNLAAQQGEDRVRQNYAECALAKNDLDLARSLLNLDNTNHEKLISRITETEAVQRRQEERHRHILYLSRALIVFVIVALAIAFTWVLNEKRVADAARVQEAKHRETAELEKEKAVSAQRIAIAEKEKAVAAHAVAERQRALAVKERERAVAAREAEARQRQKAKVAESVVHEVKSTLTQQRLSALSSAAKSARILRKTAEAQYATRLQLIESHLNQDRYNEALSLLAECPLELRNWEWGYFQNLASVDRYTLAGHSAEISLVAFSNNGPRFITGDSDGFVKVWESGLRQPLKSLNISNEPLRFLRYRADADQVVAVDQGWAVRVIDLRTNAETNHGRLQPIGATAMQLSNDERFILYGSSDGRLRAWNIHDGEVVSTIATHSAAITALAMTANLSRVYSGDADGIVNQWQPQLDLATIRLQMTPDPGVGNWSSPEPGRGAVDIAGAIAPNMSVSLTENISDPEILNSFVHDSAVTAIALSERRQRLLTGTRKGDVVIWDLETGSRVFETSAHPSGTTAVAFTDGGFSVLSAGRDGKVILWDLISKEPAVTLDTQHRDIRSLAISTDGHFILSGGVQGAASLWDVRRREKTVRMARHRTAITCADFFTRQGLVVTGDSAGTVFIWHLDGTAIAEFQVDDRPIQLVRFSKSGGTVFAMTAPDTIGIWNIQKRRLVGVLARSGTLRKMDAVDDPAEIVATNKKVIDNLWATIEIRSSRHDRFPIHSDDGELSALPSSGNASLRIWDLLSGEERFSIQTPEAVISSAVFSPDGNRIVTGASDGTLTVWSTGSGIELARIRTEAGNLSFCQFSSNGKVILAGGENGTCTVWTGRDWEIQ